MKDPMPLADPGHLARQIAKENERRELENNPNRLTTPLDLQTYLEKTGRGNLCQDVSNYDKHPVDEAILDDISKTNEPARLKRLRNLALTNLPDSWMPAPDYSMEEVKALLQKKLTQANREGWSKTPDEDAKPDAALWTNLLKILARGSSPKDIPGDERALRFLEEETNKLYGLMNDEKTEGDKTRLAGIDALNMVREAVYWRYLHPKSEIPTENPFRT